MSIQYSYEWYIQQFSKAKDTAETFLLGIDEGNFLRRPAEDQWSVAECYDHLIKYGELYLKNMEASLHSEERTTENSDQSFQPRWLVRKIISFFEPPYKMKVKTVKPMKPDSVSEYQRQELLSEYINLQDRFIAGLEQGLHNHTDLGAGKVEHPVFPILKLTLSECFALAEVHQRRHQWQAEQTLDMLKKRKNDDN